MFCVTFPWNDYILFICFQALDIFLGDNSVNFPLICLFTFNIPPLYQRKNSKKKNLSSFLPFLHIILKYFPSIPIVHCTLFKSFTFRCLKFENISTLDNIFAFMVFVCIKKKNNIKIYFVCWKWTIYIISFQFIYQEFLNVGKLKLRKLNLIRFSFILYYYVILCVIRKKSFISNVLLLLLFACSKSKNKIVLFWDLYACT
jgi:hypothetical protein